VTLAVPVVHPATGEGSAAAAESTLILRADGSAETLTIRGGLLGLGRGLEHPSVGFTLAPGDTALPVTDGISEARHGRAALEGARAFAGGSLSDDACLLLVRRV